MERPTIPGEACDTLGHRYSRGTQHLEKERAPPPQVVFNGAWKPAAQPSPAGEVTYPAPCPTSPGHIPGYAVIRLSLSPGFPVLCPVILHLGTSGLLEIPQSQPGECSQDPLPGLVRLFTRVSASSFHPAQGDLQRLTPTPKAHLNPDIKGKNIFLWSRGFGRGLNPHNSLRAWVFSILPKAAEPRSILAEHSLSTDGWSG